MTDKDKKELIDLIELQKSIFESKKDDDSNYKSYKAGGQLAIKIIINIIKEQ